MSAIPAGLEPSPEFEAWVASLDQKHWAKHDLSACRQGWEAGRASLATELLALRKRVEELEAWQDISTAPMDGTRILTESRGLVGTSRWAERFAGPRICGR